MSNLAGFLEERRKNLQYIAENADQLRREYGNRYIAVINQEVIDSDEKESRLEQRVREKYKDKHFVIRKIDKAARDFGL